jgi:hypothetical protein
MAAGTLFLAGLVALGLWRNEHQALPAPVVTTQLPDAPPAPASSPAPEVAPASPLPAEAARPSTDVSADAGEEDSPRSPGLILHRPSGLQEDAPPQAPRKRSVHRRSPGASEQTARPPASTNDRGSKTRSGASVSVDDF